METETLNPQIEESAEMTEAAEPSEVEVLGEEEQEVAELPKQSKMQHLHRCEDTMKNSLGN